MNKAVMVGGLALVGALAWLLLLRPERAPQAPRAPKTAPAETAPAVKAPSAVTPQPKPRVADSGAPPEDAAMEPDTSKAKGPFTVDLGEHRIHLRERDGRVVEIHALLTTSSHATWRELLGRKRSLVRMMFFLGTHRAADGAAADVGGASFKAELAKRFGNVIRTGAFELRFERFEVFQLPPRDAGEPR